MNNIILHLGDCLEWLPTLPNHSVDLIATDLPYGTTACSWDTIIPFEPMWAEVKRILKPRGAFVTTASQPFSSLLIASNLSWFKHEWIWDKCRGNGHLVAHFRPLQRTESVLVFCSGSPVYNPVMLKRDKPRKFNASPTKTNLLTEQIYQDGFTKEDYTERYPTNLIEFSWSNRDGIHPTQKPVALYEYLIRTYSNPGDLVCDFVMGSGTTGVATVRTGRRFQGCELNQEYYEIATRRISDAQLQPALFQLDQPKPVQDKMNL